MKSGLFKYNKEFVLESGEKLPRFQLQYTTYGELNENKDNVIWVCHALTASSEVHSWWEGMIGDGLTLDTSKYFVICANILGSCYGSTCPLETNPETQKLYLLDFPQYTIRDVVRTLNELRLDLGIQKIHTLVGGSLGGMQALEWAIMNPDLMENLIVLATNAKHSAWGIAFNETQRMAIMSDPTWKDHHPDAGKQGLRVARAVALISYRNYEAYVTTQSETDIEKTDHYKASSYQQYQGDKLINRFNCQSYWYLSKAMDSHHVGRSRGGVEKALKTIKANTLVIAISSDVLFPPCEQKFIADHVPDAVYEEINSFYGHDGFLIETKEITEIIYNFYKTKNVQYV